MFKVSFEIRGEPMSKTHFWNAYSLEQEVVLSITRDNKPENVRVKMGSTFSERGQDDQQGDLIGFTGFIKQEKQSVSVDYNCRTGLGYLNYK